MREYQCKKYENVECLYCKECSKTPNYCVRIEELEENKIYTRTWSNILFRRRGDKIEYYNDTAKDWWDKTDSLKLDRLVERDVINWSKVPIRTRIKVLINGEWKDRIFLCYDSELSCPFIVKDKKNGQVESWKYAIVEFKEEWSFYRHGLIWET